MNKNVHTNLVIFFFWILHMILIFTRIYSHWTLCIICIVLIYLWKTKNTTLLATFPNSNGLNVERCQIDTPKTQIHDRSFSSLNKGTSM